MNELIISKIIKEFETFNNDLNNDINSTSYTKILNYKECFLIKEDWYNELSQIISDKHERDNKIKILISNKKPEIINNIDSVIKLINNNFNCKLISSNLIKYGYNNKINLNSNSSVHYYAGNNKLIIEYMDKEENDSMLLLNPKENINNQQIFIFRIINKNPEKMNFYKELIANNEIDLNYFKRNNNIINYKEYNSKKEISSIFPSSIKNNNKNNHLNEPFEKNILKILISFYYYEKSLKNKEIIFNNSNKFYLMNPKWFGIFKDFYGYSTIIIKLL